MDGKRSVLRRRLGGCRCSVGALPSSTGHSPIRHRYLSAARSPPWNWPALPMLARPAPTRPRSPRTQALRQRSLQVPWRSPWLLPRQPRVPWRDVRASTVRQNEIRPLPVVGAKCVHSRSLCGFLLSLSDPLSLVISVSDVYVEHTLKQETSYTLHIRVKERLAEPADSLRAPSATGHFSSVFGEPHTSTDQGSALPSTHGSLFIILGLLAFA